MEVSKVVSVQNQLKTIEGEHVKNCQVTSTLQLSTSNVISEARLLVDVGTLLNSLPTNTANVSSLNSLLPLVSRLISTILLP